MSFRNITKIARNMMLYKNKRNQRVLNENEEELVRYCTKHEEGLSQKELAEYLNVDKALVTRMVKKLERLGYLEIHSDALDSRKKKCTPSNKAKSFKIEEKDEEMEYYKMITQVLSEKEKAQLEELIEKIYLESKRLRKMKWEK